MHRLITICLLASCAGPQDTATSAQPAGPEPAEVHQAQQKPHSSHAEQQVRPERRESIRLTNEAVDAANLGKFELAEELIRRATSVDRENHEAWFIQGQLQEHLQDHESAAAAYSEAVRGKADEATYHYRLGKAYWLLGHARTLSQAQAALEQAVQLDAKLYNAHYVLGEVYERQGKPKEAAQSWTTAATLAPSFGKSFDRLGVLYIKWHKLDEAIRVLEHGRISAQDPADLVNILYNLGVVQGMRGNWARAIASYSKALEIQPNHTGVLRQRGFAYAEVGDLEHAKTDLTSFVSQGGAGDAFQIQAANQLLFKIHAKRVRSVAAKKNKVSPVDTARAPAPTGMPAIPEFEVPPTIGDAHRVGELLVRGEPYLDTEIKVRGTVVWIYVCAEAIRTPGMSKNQLKRILREEPERCIRPHLKLADDKGADRDRGIQVVEVPREIRPDEKRALPKEVVDNWPVVPKLKVGDEVIITGTWTTRSPKGFYNSRGLLVFKSVERVR